MQTNEILQSVERMRRDIRAAAATLSDREARFLVDAYYDMQEDRVRANRRKLALDESGEPNLVIQWLGTQAGILEQQIRGTLDRYSKSHPAGAWARAQKGIGPVLASGFIANIQDPRRFSSLGKLYRYCGMDPTADERKRGERIKWNPALKRLMFLTGESFKKLSSDDPEAFYRRYYDARKAYELEKNERGDYAEQAKAALEKKRFGEDTKARAFYSSGKLPPGHIDRRACRWTAKLFLSHLHEVWWKMLDETEGHVPYPALYCIAHLGHMDHIPPPPG